VDYLWAFVIGGALCAVAQLVVDLTPLTPAHTMVLFVSLGAVAAGLGVYEPMVKLAGAGATVPLPGFGYALVKGILKETAAKGALGLLTGGLTATSLGITAAVLFGYLMAVVFNPKG
jgi:stage V sporulation protein AE